MDTMTIRKATNRDQPELAALQRRSMRTVAAGYYSSRQIDAFLAVATPELANLLRVGTVWLAWSGSELAASAAWHFEGVMPTLGRSIPQEDGIAVFRTLYVQPEWTRRGLASTMMATAETDARSNGATCAKLHAMLSAVEFYRTRGYEAIEETVFDLAGIPFPGVAMTRALIEPATKAA